MGDFVSEEEAKRLREEKKPATTPSGYTPIAGGGGIREGRGLLDRLSGESNYTAQFPGYNNEAGFNDRNMSVQARGQQQELGNAIQDRALGRGGPSVAELQMQRGLGIAQQRLRNQAVSGRGMNRGAAQRQALRGASDLYAQTNEQAGIMRAQEQIAAQQLASQNVRDMRQQDLLSRGYSIEEAKAILDAQVRTQEINANLAAGDAARGQGPAMMGIAAAGGLLAASDARSKDIMYSDFTMKEGPRPAPARTDMLAPAAPQPPVRADAGYQPMLTVAPTPEVDKSAEEHQRSLGEQAVAAAADGGGGDLGSQAKTGFDIGSALGGVLGGLSDIRAKELMPSDFTGKEMGKARVGKGAAFDISPERIHRMGDFEIDQARKRYRDSEKRRNEFDRLKYIREQDVPSIERSRTAMISDFREKEPSMGELDQVAHDAMLPFHQMDEQESRQALAPVDPVVYRYKEGPSERMADDQAAFADMRAKYAGMGGAQPEEESAIREGTYADKREPRLGIVAQQLQQSPAFRQSVVSTPAGLAVQRDRALSTALGSLAGIDKRLRDLENLGDSKSAEIRGEPVEVERARRRFKERGGANQSARGMSEDESRMFARYAR